MEWRKLGPKGTIDLRVGIPDYIKKFLPDGFDEIQSSALNNEVVGDNELIGLEGKVRQEIKLHKIIERDSVFRFLYKSKYARIKVCPGCNLDPLALYNLEPINFFEMHHITPLANFEIG